MSYHIKYSSKDEFYAMAAKKCNTWLSQLMYVEQTLNHFAVMPQFQGAAADSLKSYFFDVHGTLISGIRHAIEDFYCRLALFAYGYYDIDGFYSAELPEESLQNLKDVLSSEETLISGEIVHLARTLANISDILWLSTPGADNVYAAIGDLKNQIDLLGTSIQNYETRKQAEANGALGSVITSVSNAIKSRSQVGTSIIKYQPGSCFTESSMEALRQNIAISSQNTEKHKATINDIVKNLGPYSGKEGPHTIIPPNLEGVQDIEGREYTTMDELVRNGTIPALLGAVMGSVGIAKVSGSGVVEKTKNSIQGAVKYAKKDVEYDLFGLDVKDTSYGDLIGGTAKYDANFGFKIKADDEQNFDKDDIEINASIKGEAEGHVATGKISTSSAYHNGNAEGSFLTGGVEGEVGIGIFENGKFNPSISAEASAEAAVAEGSIDLRLGEEDNNVHAKAEGTVLGAEAEASVAAGRIKIKDKVTGEETVVTGAKAEARAEAYLAEGRISGGIEIFGIKVDIGVEGKAGGAGAGAGGYVSTGGVSGELDVGLGVGLGLDISIDWTGFKLPWK